MVSHQKNARRSSWRQESAGASSSPSARWTARILAALAVVGLTVLCVWWFLPPPQVTRHLLAVTMEPAEGLVATPTTYVAEDAVLLDSLKKFQRPDDAQVATTGWTEARRQLHKLSGGSDVVLMYISASGYGKEGIACLGQGGRDLPFGSLLKDFDPVGDGLKLVVLDVGRIDSDVQRGWLVNELPRLIDKELSDREAKNLWVLLANGCFERSHVSHPLRRSVFATALAEGLAGKSDESGFGNQDGWVGLAELYRYLLYRCGKWFPEESSISQTPLLIHAGEGYVTPEQVPTDESCQIVAVQKDWQPPEVGRDYPATSESSAGDAESGDVSADNASEGKDAPSGDSRASELGADGTGARNGSESAVSATEADDASSSNSDSDETSSATGDGSQRPAEAKPADRQASSEEEPAADAARGEAIDSEGDVQGPRQLLDQAWRIRDRLESREDTFAGLSPVDFAPHRWQEMLAWLVVYEHSVWTGDLSAVPDANSLKEGIEKRLAELQALDGAMAARPRPPERDLVGDTLLSAWKGFLQTRSHREPRSHELNKSAREARAWYNEAAQRAPWYVRWHRLGLMTGAADEKVTTQTRELLDRLIQCRSLLSELEGKRRPEQLESCLTHFADLHLIRRQLDSRLVYESQLILMKKNIEDPTYQQRAEDLRASMCLVDPRDVPGVVTDFLLPPHPLTVETPAFLDLVRVGAPDELLLEDKEPVETQLDVVATEARLLDNLQWTVTCDEQWVDVQQGEQSAVEQSGDGHFFRRVTWAVSARGATDAESSETSRTIKFSVRWQDGVEEAADEYSVVAVLPSENRIDLAWQRNGAAADPALRPTVDWSLDANRSTRYQLMLFNRSRRPQKVQARVFAIPNLPNIKLPPGVITPDVKKALYDESSGELTDSLQVLAQTAEPVALPAEPRAIPLLLTAPAAPGTVAPDAKDDKATGNAPTPTPSLSFKAADVSRGLVVLITSEEDDAHWVKWIELAPRHPEEFLDVKVELDVETNRIIALVRPLEGAPLPAGESILVEWETAGEAFLPDGARQDAGTMTIKDGVVTPPELSLFATVDPQAAEQWTVRLSVNGYPRAFHYVVKRPAAGAPAESGKAANRSLREVRITSLAMEGDPRVIHLPPYGTMPEAEPEKKEEKEPPVVHIAHPANEEVVFSDARPLKVTLAVDAPRITFARGSGVRTFVWLKKLVEGEGESKHELLSDRRFTAELKNVTGGELVFDTDVRDHSLTLETLGWLNVETLVEAQLEVPGGRDGGTDLDFVRVQFDGDKPQARIDRERKVNKGEPLRANLTVDDRFGIRRIRYALTPRDVEEIPADKGRELEVRLGPGLHEVKLLLPTDEVAPANWNLLAQAFDKTGRPTDTVTCLVTVIDPATLPGYIKGVVRFNGARLDPGTCRVEINGEPVDVSRDGSFVHGPLPPGKYTITARGTFGNSRVEGEVEGVVPAPLNELKPQNIPVNKGKKTGQ